MDNYLKEQYYDSPEYSRDQLCDNEHDTLRILFYIGKADSQLRAAERSIIRDFCRTIAKDNRITDDLIDRLFRDMKIPSLQAFKLAVGRLQNKSTEEKRRIVETAIAMIATQKTVHPMEKEAVEYMQKKWNISLDKGANV